jgi:hypothetical protein
MYSLLMLCTCYDYDLGDYFKAGMAFGKDLNYFVYITG